MPKTENGLRRAIGEAHRRYTRRINFREQWRGYLWQGRFASFIMDEPYLLAAARYVELNPVRAELAVSAAEWPWSSAKAHLSGRDDRLVKVAPLLAMIGDWRGFLNSAIREEELRDLREHGRTGRPLGNAMFLDHLEAIVGRILNTAERRSPNKTTHITITSIVSPEYPRSAPRAARSPPRVTRQSCCRNGTPSPVTSVGRLDEVLA